MGRHGRGVYVGVYEREKREKVAGVDVNAKCNQLTGVVVAGRRSGCGGFDPVDRSQAKEGKTPRYRVRRDRRHCQRD